MELRENAELLNALKGSTAWHTYDRECAVAPSHAYLVVSEDEIALENLVLLMCARAYCPQACLSCAECRKVLSHNKPDVQEVNPKGEDISVDAATGIVEDAMLGSFEGGRKIYVLRAMHLQKERVQNLLLKTLEEPNDNVTFLLTAASTKGILPTVLSRVKTLSLTPFAERQVVDILHADGIEESAVIAKAAMGNLTLAVSLATDEDYFAVVDEVVELLSTLSSSAEIPLWLYRPIFAKDALAKTLNVMEIAVKDLVYVQCGATDSVVYRNKMPIYKQTTGFPPRALPLIIDQINLAKLKVNAYCTAVNVADSLLLGILEVKSLCKRS